MGYWKVNVYSEAQVELRALMKTDPGMCAELERLFAKLIREEDPGHPEDEELRDNVIPLRHYDGWYRLRVMKFYSRIVFRLMVERGDNVVEISTLPAPHSAVPKFIQIVQATTREFAYGLNLAERFFKCNPKKVRK